MTTSHRTLALMLLVTLVVATSGIALPQVAAADQELTLLDDITADTHYQNPIATDGETVVWFAPGSANAADYESPSQLRGARLSDRNVFVIAEFPVSNQKDFVVHVDGNLVVWANERRLEDPESSEPVIRGKDLSTGSEFVVANRDMVPNLSQVDSLAISSSSGWIVWASYSIPDEISFVQARQFREGEGIATLAQDGVDVDPRRPDRSHLGNVQIQGNVATWGMNYSSEIDGFQTVVVFDLENRKTEYIDLTGIWYGNYEFEASAIIFATLPDITTASYKIVDPSTHSSRIVSMTISVDSPSSDGENAPIVSVAPGNFTFDGRYIAQYFNVFRGHSIEDEWKVVAYDTWTNSHFTVFNALPHGIYASHGGLVWIDQGGAEVHAALISDLLPSAPRPDPGTTDPAWFYFNETGHYLSYGFKDFWIRSGGLPVFGFPLTTEYDELNPDMDEFRTVQYTERQRFEYHPELAGTPYETLLGRLGAADAEQRGLDEHPAFVPVDKPTSAGVEYFAVTGHTLRGPFRDYWQTHGLDFGDPGMSYRESLALFGYPISEEFIDPDTGLKTQYFERAVFEFHPHNPDPYKVLLRRLGAEEMERRGW
jgi:hypothetical protein